MATDKVVCSIYNQLLNPTIDLLNALKTYQFPAILALVATLRFIQQKYTVLFWLQSFIWEVMHWNYNNQSLKHMHDYATEG